MSKIKICGLFREEDIEFANEAKPDFVGFVFAPGGKRFVDAAKATALRAKLSPGISSVGVFVNAEIDYIVQLLETKVIDIVQLHGRESDRYIEVLHGRTGAKIIRAYKTSPLCEYTLLDSATPGSGVAFDWAILKGLDLSKNIFLAGGVNFSNIREALALKPFAVDVSSGAETNGIKDRSKILDLVKITRSL